MVVLNLMRTVKDRDVGWAPQDRAPQDLVGRHRCALHILDPLKQLRMQSREVTASCSESEAVPRPHDKTSDSAEAVPQKEKR